MSEYYSNQYIGNKVYRIEGKYCSIYKIEPKVNHAEDECYIGSTTYAINERLKGHIWGYNSYKRGKSKSFTTSYKLFEKYGAENCQITLIESVFVKSFKELNEKENEYIQKSKCINKCGKKQKENDELDELDELEKELYEILHKK